MTPQHPSETRYLWRPKDRISQPLVVSLLLVVVVFLAYANSLQGEFVWDDRTLFVEYYDVWQWKNLKHLLTTQDNLFRYNATGFYRPLTNVTFLVDRWIWGKEAAGFHLTNLLFHALAVVAVFGIARHLLGGLWAGAGVALLFAVHPVNTEAVAWINGRNNLVSIAFYLLAFNGYLAARTPGNRTVSLLSMAALALSLLSKEYAVTFPLLVLLTEAACPLSGESRSEAARRAFGWCMAGMAVIALYGLLRAAVVPTGAGAGLELERVGERLLIVPKIFTGYLRLLVFPVDLTPFHRVEPVSGPGDPQFWFPLMFCTALTVLWLFACRRSGPLGFALGWVGVTLLPVLNIIPVPHAADLIAERHLYMPSAGFCLLPVLGMRAVWRRGSGRGLRWWVALCAVPVLLLAEVYGFATLRRNLAWRNELTLWEDTAEQSPGDHRAHINLAIACARAGLWVRGVQAARAAVRLAPDQAKVHFVLGVILIQNGRPAEALASLERAIALDPTHTDAAALIQKLRKAWPP